jgi:hypothetical protein
MGRFASEHEQSEKFLPMDQKGLQFRKLDFYFVNFVV